MNSNSFNICTVTLETDAEIVNENLNQINNIYKNTDNYSTRLKQRKGVTSMFLETFNKFPKVKYVHVNTNMPELLEQYENVSWQT